MSEESQLIEREKAWPLDREFKRVINENLPLGWFTISWHLIEGRKERINDHGKWFKISLFEGGGKGNTIYRLCRFDGSLAAGVSRDPEILLDYLGWVALKGGDPTKGNKTNGEERLRLRIEKVGLLESLCSYRKIVATYPDPSYRLANNIALIALFLGVVSLVITVITTVLALRS